MRDHIALGPDISVLFKKGVLVGWYSVMEGLYWVGGDRAKRDYQARSIVTAVTGRDDHHVPYFGHFWWNKTCIEIAHEHHSSARYKLYRHTNNSSDNNTVYLIIEIKLN
jgi:hypothetical protein